MADDEISGNLNAANASAQALEDSLAGVGDAADKTAKQINKATAATEKSLAALEKQFPKISKQLVDMKKKLKPVLKETDALSDSLQSATDHTKLLDKAIDRAMGGNQKQILASLLQFRKYGNAIKDAANQSVELSQRMDEFTGIAKQAASRVDGLKKALDESTQKSVENQEAISKLEKQIEKGGEEAEKFKEELLKLQTAQKGLIETEKQAKEALEANETERVAAIQNLENHAQAYGEMQKKVLDLRDTYMQTVKEERRVAAELKIMSGGLQAFTGHVQKFKNEKFFEYMEKFQGTFLLTYGFHKIGSAIQDTSAIMASTAGIARTLGKDTKTGLGDFWNSAKQAQEATSALMYTSGELGIAFDKVSEAGSRIRTNIRFDREGQFSEKAIAGMTRAAAEFSKVAGVDMDQSVAMIEKRIKQFGMTSEEAVADVNAMRISLQQMMVGVKNEVIAMDEMVRLIEDASDASKAYVVDTRLLTQALRGAATQAGNLGDTQKQAKDVTQAVAKVFGDAPDFIKIPAGYDLLEQLTGGDTDGFLEKFDTNTRKQLTAIRDSLKKGEIDKYTAARAIMDATAGTEAGQEATMKRLSKTILGSTAAAEIIAETYGIENRNTAFQLQKILKDTDKFQAALEKEMGHKISFASAMAKDVAVFDEMIGEMEKAGKSTGDQVAKLKEKGLSAEDAEAYLKARKAGLEFEEKAKKELKALDGDTSEAAVKRRAELEKEIYKQTTLQQAKLLDNALHPGKKLLNELREKIPGRNLEIHSDLKGDDLKKAFANSKALADAFQITNKDNLARLQRVYDGHESITAEQLEDMRQQESEANKKQIESITATATKFNEGILTGLKYVSISMLGGLGKWLHDKGILDEKYLNAFGPITQAVLGVGAAIGGLVLIWRGFPRMLASAVEKGVRAAGGIGGDQQGPPDLRKKGKLGGIFRKGGALGKEGRIGNFLKGAGGKLLGGVAAGGLALYSDKDKIAEAYSKRGLGSAALNALPAILSTVGGAGGMALGAFGGPLGSLALGAGGGAGGEWLGRTIVEAIEGNKEDEGAGVSPTAAATALGTTGIMGSALAGQQMAQSNQAGIQPSGTGFFPQAGLGAAGSPGAFKFPALQANAGATSFNPSDGKLTLEVANWGEIMAQFKKASSSFGIFG